MKAKMARGQRVFVGDVQVGTVIGVDPGPVSITGTMRKTHLLAPLLTDEEAECLAVAVRAVYMPGVVAVQTRFHGRYNPKSRATFDRLMYLQSRGFLRGPECVHARDVDTTSWYFTLTERGRDASRSVVLPIKGAMAHSGSQRMASWRVELP